MVETLTQKHMTRKAYSLITAWCIAAVTTVAAAASFEVDAPPQVEVGQSFQVVYKLSNAQGTNLQAPRLEGFKYLYGPAHSEMSYTSNINGKVTSSTMQSFTFTYRAEAAGRYTIPAASIEVGGRRLSSRPRPIEVVASSGGGRSGGMPPMSGYDPRTGVDPYAQTAGKQISADDAFVHVGVAKKSVYEQEAVLCTISLYTKYEGQISCTKQPSFEDCLIEEIPLDRNNNTRLDTFNGKKYLVVDLGKYILYPQHSGKVTITSGNYDITVVQRDVYQALGYVVSLPVGTQVQVQSNQASVEVRPLPEPKPAGFSGAVGTYRVSASLSSGSFKTYAPATYSLAVSGTGNLKYITAPEVKFPEQFDVYDPESDVKTNPTGGSNVSGTVRFNYRFIPQFAGEFDIPATDFIFFNTETQKYETIHVPGKHLTVAKAQGKQSSHYKLRNLDIDPLITGDMQQARHRSYMVSSWGYWLAYAAAAVAAILLALVNRKRIKRNSDDALVRTRRASKVATRRLKRARQLQAAGNREGFYAEMLTALWGYLGDRLTIPVSELSKDNIASVMQTAGFDDDHVTSTLALLDKCEFAQYAPELATGDMAGILDEGATLIDRLENVKIKKTPQS